MCGRFTLTDPDADLAVQFNLPEIPDMQPRYNIAPTQPVAAVRLAPESAAREMALLHWGLIPFWAKDPSIGKRMINARSETAAEKPAFRAAFQAAALPGGGRWLLRVAETERRQAAVFSFTCATGSPLPLPGCGSSGKVRTRPVIESCTLLTTEPNDLIRPLHNRMPVILHPRDYELWLDLEVEDRDAVAAVVAALSARRDGRLPGQPLRQQAAERRPTLHRAAA